MMGQMQDELRLRSFLAEGGAMMFTNPVGWTVATRNGFRLVTDPQEIKALEALLDIGEVTQP